MGRAGTAGALVALAALIAACGGGGTGGRPAAERRAATATVAEPAAIQRAGTVAELADCGDWRRFSRAQRYEAIAEIRGLLTPQRSRSAASPVSDARAYEVFQRACGPAYAASLRLYKLYVRVKGFAPLSGG